MPDGPNPGLATDASGDPVIDPTANVLQLVAAAMQRQDDLREADNKRQDDLRNAEKRHQSEIADLRAHFGREVREKEAARIDAIRAVDVQAVQRAAEVQATQAQALAATVAASAEAMRNQVASAATAQTIALTAAIDPIKTDIADLRRAQYEAQGQKTQVVETQARGGSLGLWIGVGIAGLGAWIGVVGLVVALLVR